jgi:hypothetical protein
MWTSNVVGWLVSDLNVDLNNQVTISVCMLHCFEPISTLQYELGFTSDKIRPRPVQWFQHTHTRCAWSCLPTCIYNCYSSHLSCDLSSCVSLWATQERAMDGQLSLSLLTRFDTHFSNSNSRRKNSCSFSKLPLTFIKKWNIKIGLYIPGTAGNSVDKCPCTLFHFPVAGLDRRISSDY